nr:MmgE/PrpD family protein [Pseudomonadota bacterium]
GRGLKTDILHAALINGISSHVFDFDDTHPDTLVHPSGPVASAVLALGEYLHASGPDLVNAFVVGVEVECRVARAVLPAHYDVGWHITGTAGIFGAAAASARLLGLSEAQTTWALGLAATQAAGLREMFGSMAKSLHPGRAAQNGLSSALLAQADFTSADTGLEGVRGFAHVMSTSVDLSRALDGLGSGYELLRNTYKPFACGLVVHPVIDACIQLRDEAGVKADQVDCIVLEVHPLVLELTAKADPRSGLEGKFSVFHAAAAALLDGAGGQAQFTDERVNSPDIVALRGKVQAQAVSGMEIDAANVKIVLRDGTSRQRNVAHCVGSGGQPMSDRQLEDKFRALCSPVIGASQAEAALTVLRGLEDLDDVQACASALAGPAVGG